MSVSVYHYHIIFSDSAETLESSMETLGGGQGVPKKISGESRVLDAMSKICNYDYNTFFLDSAFRIINHTASQIYIYILYI